MTAAGTALDLSTADAVIALTHRLVTDAFTAENIERQANRDPDQLTMSGLGGCTKAIAHLLAGTPASDVPPEEDARQAMLGVWIDERLVPRMAALLGSAAVAHQRVELRAAGLVIPGELDLAIGEVVWDLKTVKEWRLHGVQRRGTYSEHRLQVMGYALARYQAGHPVRWVVFLYLDRSTGQVHVEVEAFTNAAALAVIERAEQLRLHAQNPDKAPRDGRGPGLSFACDRCRWLTRCYGPDARPNVKGSQKFLAATQAGIEEALALYAQAAAVSSVADKDKEFAKLVLAGLPDDTYGAWMLRHGQASESTDMDAVTRHYADLGLPLPKKPKAGAISVKPAPQGIG